MTPNAPSIWLWWLLLLGLLPAQSGPVKAKPASYLHGALLDRAPIVVLARFQGDSSLGRGNIQITNFDVLETLKGENQERVLVAGMGDRATAFKDLDKLLFLEPMSSGQLFTLVDVVDLPSGDSAERLKAVRSYLALDALRDLHARELRRRQTLMEGLASRSSFWRKIAVRDLDLLTKSDPKSFSADDLKRLDALAGSCPNEELGRYQAALARLRGGRAGGLAVIAESIISKESRDAYLEAAAKFEQAKDPVERAAALDRMALTAGYAARPVLRALLQGNEPILADRAAFHLGEMGDDGAITSLLSGLSEASRAGKRARVTALGKLAAVAAVPVLSALVDDPDLRFAAMQALARIATADANKALDEVERKLASRSPPSTDLERLRLWRSESFRQTDVERRQRAWRRYGR